MPSWTITYFSEGVQKSILSLPTTMLARFLRYADRMEEHGPDLGMPHTRAMGKGLFELRLKATEGIARVFYCVSIGRKIIILHSFIKKTQKTPSRELKLAIQRMKEIIDVES